MGGMGPLFQKEVAIVNLSSGKSSEASIPRKGQTQRHWLLSFLLLLLLWICAFGFSARGDDTVEPVGIYLPNFFAELQDVELGTDRAYVFGVGGLAIMDISDPNSPVLLGRYEPPGHPYNRFYRGTVGGHYAYGGGREDLMSIIDISFKVNPQLVTTHGTAGMSYEGMTIEGPYLYAARHADGIEILSLNNPAIPQTVAEVTSLANSWDLTARDGYAFVADGNGGLAVLEVIDPTLPSHLYSLSTSGAAVDVDIEGDLAAVACGSAGVDLFDIGTPENASWLGNYNSSGLAITLDIVGDKLYLADWDDIEVIDLSIPESPSRLGWENTPVRAMGLAANTDRIFVADWSRLRTYEFGPTTRGDIDLLQEEINFGEVPVGSTVDTTFTVANTGGGVLEVIEIESFNPNFVILSPTNFFLDPGESQDVVVEFFHESAGYDGTFLAVRSMDTHEPQINLPVSADDDPSFLDIGEAAPEFSLQDMDGVMHSLEDYGGKVVVLAFFANW